MPRPARLIHSGGFWANRAWTSRFVSSVAFAALDAWAVFLEASLTRTPRRTRPVILAVITAVAAALALPAGSAGAAPGRGHTLHDDLVARAGGHAAFRAAHGDAGAFFGTAPGHAAKRPSDVSASATPAVAAKGWLAHYGSLFGVADA